MDDVGLDIGHNSTSRALNFKTGSTDRLTITGGGNVLIGTTTDSGEKLQVLGNIKLCTSNASYYLSIENNLSYANPFNLIGAFGVELLTLNSGQISTATNVGAKFGVGTKSPTEKLHVVGDALITGDSHADAFKPAVSGYKTEIAGNLALSLGADRYLRIGSSTNYWWDFKSVSNDLQLLEAGTTARIIVKAGGNVLIGTTTDSGEKLVVDGDIKINDNTIKIGINNDLLLYHDGSNSYIKEVGTGTLRLQTNGTGIDFYKNSTEFLARLITDAAVELYYDSVKKFETTSTGISVTGGANFSGNVSIGGTAGAVYKFDVVGKARVQSVLELDDVLTLNQISTPADPASGKSSIYMDSADGAIKVKINVGGTVVTRTIASFE